MPTLGGKDSTEYRRNSFLAARRGIQWHFSSFQHGINIFSDCEFEPSNKILNGLLKAEKKKKNGREEAVVHKPVISNKDWQKLEEYFADVLTTLNPHKLTFFVWLQISVHFCLILKRSFYQQLLLQLVVLYKK